MPSGKLQGLRVAVFVTDGFEVPQLLEPRRALDHAGAATYVIAPHGNEVIGLTEGQIEIQLPVDIPLKSAKAEDFHALLLPGGKQNVQQSLRDGRALEFVRCFARSGKPVAATGESIGILSEAGLLSGRRMFPRLADNPERHAGYSDHELVITARSRDDLSCFIHEMVDVLAAIRAQSPDMRRTA
jgi:protease I